MAVEKPLGERLIEAGLINESQLGEALRAQRVTGERLGRTLVRLGHIAEDDVIRVLCDEADVPFVDVAAADVPGELAELLPESVARAHDALALERAGGRLTVALADPFDMEAVGALERVTRHPISVVAAPRAAILARIETLYGNGGPDRIEDVVGGEPGRHSGRIAADMGRSSAARAEGGPAHVGATDRAGSGGGESDADVLLGTSLDFGTDPAEPAESAPEGGTAAQLAEEVIERGIALGATDIHIEPVEDEVRVRYRLDGVLRPGPSFPVSTLGGIVTRIKIMAGLNIAETRLPQDGRVRRRGTGRDVDLRISTFPTVHGEDVVLRILDKQRVRLELERSGMVAEDIELVRRALERPHGLITVTGPTGSGKTTTLYSALRELNSGDRCIITLEDPVEYEVEGIRQSQVNARAGLTFASGLRSILRHDPDVILVGEMRDAETVRMGLSAALTGHLVLTTVHTNTAVGAIPRLLDMGAEPFILASSLELVIAQRLVRKLCAQCKEPIEVPTPVRERFGLTDVEIYRARGCSACRETGYRGRVGIFELLPITNRVADGIHRGASGDEIRALIDRRPTLLEDGLRKVRAGITTLDEILRVTAG